VGERFTTGRRRELKRDERRQEHERCCGSIIVAAMRVEDSC
jgi:hypothetical protein